MTVIARKNGRLERIAIVAIAALIAGIMGIRSPRVRAVSFGDIELQGGGRATLKITQTQPVSEEGAPPLELEVFARLTYASELSRFDRGLYMRTVFAIPGSTKTGVLVVDVDRTRGLKQWASDSRGLAARLYMLSSRDAKTTEFDGSPASGSISLDASVVGAQRAGFRIGGFFEMRDAGEDGRADTEDDVTFDVEIELESIPAPEEITGQTPRPPHEPSGGECDPTWCWQDDTYYDGYWYGPSCGDASVGYETSDDGCSSDTVEDDDFIDDGGGGGGGGGGVYDPYEPTVEDDGGCDGSDTTDTDGDGFDDSSDSSGCESSDDTDSSSSGGCDGGDDTSSDSGCGDSGSSGSGCSDSSSSGCSDSASGCGEGASACGSGCEGDTLQRDPGAVTSKTSKNDLGWVAVLLFIGSIGAAVRRGRDD